VIKCFSNCKVNEKMMQNVSVIRWSSEKVIKIFSGTSCLGQEVMEDFSFAFLSLFHLVLILPCGEEREFSDSVHPIMAPFSNIVPNTRIYTRGAILQGH
jgi:hypothetical protein